MRQQKNKAGQITNVGLVSRLLSSDIQEFSGSEQNKDMHSNRVSNGILTPL